MKTNDVGLVLVSVLLMSLFHCDSGSTDDTLVTSCIASLAAPVAVNTFEDPGDGTLKRTSRFAEIPASFCNAFVPGFTLTSFIKKCAQGQVHRIAQNDCRGAGNAANDYGATTFAYCASADNSCQDANRLAQSPASPAAASCATETLGGKTWNILPSLALTGNSLGDADGLFALLPEAPAGSYWYREADFGDAARARALELVGDGTSTFSTGVKTEMKFVLCSAWE